MVLNEEDYEYLDRFYFTYSDGKMTYRVLDYLTHVKDYSVIRLNDSDIVIDRSHGAPDAYELCSAVASVLNLNSIEKFMLTSIMSSTLMILKGGTQVERTQPSSEPRRIDA